LLEAAAGLLEILELRPAVLSIEELPIKALLLLVRMYFTIQSALVVLGLPFRALMVAPAAIRLSISMGALIFLLRRAEAADCLPVARARVAQVAAEARAMLAAMDKPRLERLEAAGAARGALMEQAMMADRVRRLR
jgi:hypothetical protein